VRHSWIPIEFYAPVQKQIHGWPYEVRKELGAVLTRLQKGESIGLPDVRPMSDIGKGVSEIRVSVKAGEYRVFYVVVTKAGILVFHSFKKKTQATPKKELETARIRLRAQLEELDL